MKRALAWAAARPVFANLLMVFFIVAGALALWRMRRELFPEFNFDQIRITAVYPGAAPEEVEKSLAIKIEEAVRGEAGVRKVESTSAEGRATVVLEVDAAVRDPRDVLVDVRNQISRITTFPEDVDEPAVELVANRRDVLSLVLSGPLEEESLTHLAQQVEDELLLIPSVSEVVVTGVRDYEIAALVQEGDLQRYGLTFAEVSAAIGRASLDLPIGRLRSPDEEQLLRVERQREVGRELESVPVVVRQDGTRILLRQVARIADGFTEDEAPVRLDGVPAVTFAVRRSPDEDTVAVAEAVKAYVAGRQATLPPQVRLELWTDQSQRVVERLELLSENGAQGLVLVFLSLVVFLGLRLSIWVALGLPVAFLAAMLFLTGFGGSLNMITSFALIMILGILVDDSIVVGENVARHMREGGYTLRAAIAGLHEVTWPVVASVTTTAVAFMPLFFLGGTMGKFIRVMPVAVVACLLASLLECLFILPAHLAHQRHGASEGGLRARIDAWTDRFVHGRYGPSVDWALRNRYAVVTGTAGFMILVLALVASGRPAFVFFPRLDDETIRATITMPQGTPLARTLAVVSRLEQAASDLRASLPPAAGGGAIVRRSLAQAGQSGPHAAQVDLELCSSAERELKSLELIKRWRELAGEFPEARSVTFGGTGGHGPGGRPLELRLLADSQGRATEAAQRVLRALDTYPGVFNVEDNLEPGKRELRFDVRPEADALGVSVADMARQLYAGFSGQEVHKVQRGRDEVEVRVRYEPGQRERRAQLDQLRIRAGGAGLVPLGWAASVERARGLSRIERRGGQRVVTITGEIDDTVTNANQVLTALREGVVGELEGEGGVRFDFGGQAEEQKETMVGLGTGFLVALFGIYAILALLFDSYIQPLVVMGAIPVGFAGAILGHIAFGSPLTIFSVFGMVGLTGIVVNDALVLIDFINSRRAQQVPLERAVREAGRVRFRAVFLTTLTTVLGLCPLLLETSLQAQFLIPMAISIAAGVALATVLTLYVVPCIYVILAEVRGLFFARPEAS